MSRQKKIVTFSNQCPFFLTDSECQGTLTCFQRRTGDPGPYGCVGTTEASTDYCFDASDIPSGFLARVANDGDPSSLYPLERCLGDCDSDEDCMGSLECFQRRSSDPGPPNCSGNTDGSTDYCYDRNDDGDDDDDTTVPPPGTLGRVANDGEPSSLYPLARCLGDCDRDNDCSGSLECYQRSSNDRGPPNCSGNTEASTDYCYNPADDEQDDDGGSGSCSGNSFVLRMYWEVSTYIFWFSELYLLLIELSQQCHLISSFGRKATFGKRAGRNDFGAWNAKDRKCFVKRCSVFAHCSYAD